MKNAGLSSGWLLGQCRVKIKLAVKPYKYHTVYAVLAKHCGRMSPVAVCPAIVGCSNALRIAVFERISFNIFKFQLDILKLINRL